MHRLSALALVLLATPVSAAPGNEVWLAPADMPAAVRALAECDTGDDIRRQRFHGRVLFVFRCPGNNENFIQAFVASEDDAGRGATPLTFPATPYSRGEPLRALSNARLFEGTGTIGEIWVDTEAARGAPCRFESLFRLGRAGAPRLVFHRDTKDCQPTSRTRWRTVLDRRTKAERQDDWR